MKKKLLHIVLYLVYGGLEKIVYDFSKRLNKRDYEVHVAALEKGGPIGDLLLQEGIPVHILGKKPGKFDFYLLFKLIKLIKDLEIQVIHSHSACIMYAALAGRLAGVKVIIHTEHGRYLPDRMAKILEDRIFSRIITKHVCVSRDLETYMRETVKVPRTKLTTIINGVNTSQYCKYTREQKSELRLKYDITPNSLVLGTVCRLIPTKNVSFLIDWLKKYHYQHQNLHLIVVGDGPQLVELQERAKFLPGGRVQFLGARKEIADILNTFDIFTLVSKTEGTSLTILEAMATELPVIVSNVGGNKDIIQHESNGFLFECNNQENFEECLNNVQKNQGKAHEMGQRARETVLAKFSFLKVINTYCELYNQNG